ncbi:MAG: beta-lactamase family protein, partial [Gluconacetobacter diazotrophicus]|nr:beta-lactamase family protein [Gluconacetobacter diazotrophicus]
DGIGDRPLDPDSIVEIGSITKVFTTALLAETADAGLVDLDRPIGTYLPGVPLRPCTARITPTELADFTSGLPELPDDVPRRLDRRGLANYTPADFLRWLSRTVPDTGCDLPAPYRYSNASVGLLGPILFHATGRPWRELLARTITVPLGMADTAIDPARPGRVQGHLRDGRPAPPWPVFSWFAAGALRSTAADMLAFGEAALGHPRVGDRPVPPALVAALRRAMRPIYQPPGRFFSQGLAWASAPDGTGGTMAYKDGGTVGFTTILVVDPAKDCTLFLAADRAGIDMQRLGLQLMRAIPPGRSPRNGSDALSSENGVPRRRDQSWNDAHSSGTIT